MTRECIIYILEIITGILEQSLHSFLGQMIITEEKVVGKLGKLPLEYRRTVWINGKNIEPIKISKCTKRSFLEKIHWNLKIFMALNSRLLKEIQRLIVQIFYPFMVLRYGLEIQRVRKHCLQI